MRVHVLYLEVPLYIECVSFIRRLHCIQYTHFAQLLTASNVEERAVYGGHPEVGGARVKHHRERLGRTADPNLTIILSLWRYNSVCKLANHTVVLGLWRYDSVCIVLRYNSVCNHTTVSLPVYLSVHQLERSSQSRLQIACIMCSDACATT